MKQYLSLLLALTALTICTAAPAFVPVFAQEQETPAPDSEQPEENSENQEEEPPEIIADIKISGSPQTLVKKNITFSLEEATIPDEVIIQEVVWNFGDGVRTTGTEVTHAYQRPGSYTARVTVRSEDGQEVEDSLDITIFDEALIVLADNSVSEEELELKRQEAARENLLLVALRARGGGPEALVEEDLTAQLINARDALARSNLIIAWTGGSVGSSVLSKFAQHVRQTDEFSFTDLSMESKGVIILSDTPFGVLAPTAQSAFDQLLPSYILLTRPAAINLLLTPLSAEEAKETVFASPIQYRLLGTFSSRTVTDIGLTNFVSFGINYLVNQGVPIGSITLILMLPVIATILSFSRQVIGIKAFGLITPAMTTLSFLVIGLQYGLIVFSVVLLAGTLTRLLMRHLHLLYLPRMALVLSTVSVAILVLFGIGAALNNTSLLSFSVFPILILTLLAEEFIALQFKSGPRQALIVTSWTLALSILGYYIVSWQLLRTIIISYPEVVLLSIPANILLGRWTGLRLTEYFRFRKLLRYVQS